MTAAHRTLLGSPPRCTHCAMPLGWAYQDGALCERCYVLALDTTPAPRRPVLTMAGLIVGAWALWFAPLGVYLLLHRLL